MIWLYSLIQTTCNLEPACEAKIRKFKYSVHPGVILSRVRAIACCNGSFGPPYQNVYMSYLQNWDKYNVVVIIYSLIAHTHTHTNREHAHTYMYSKSTR